MNTEKKNDASIQLVKDSEPEQIKLYFGEILHLTKSGREFPIDLDNVWALAYTRKSSAVRTLQSDFIQNVDYQTLHQKVQGGKHNTSINTKYMLSVAAFEYFIAKKVQPVFEVYRQVFHRALNSDMNTKRLSDEASYIEGDVFIGKLGNGTIHGMYKNGELWYSLSAIMSFVGYASKSPTNTYSSKIGVDGAIKEKIGLQDRWLVNVKGIDRLLEITKFDMPYKKLSVLYKDLFKIIKNPNEDKFDYHYTSTQMTELLFSLNQRPINRNNVIDLLEKGKGATL